MANEKRPLDAQVALVVGGGERLGRAVALALAARGVRVVVTGKDERALGETVGEIAFGGGKARHVAGDSADPAVLAAAVARAREVFGPIDICVVPEEGVTPGLFGATATACEGARRFIALGAPIADSEGLADIVVYLCSSAADALDGQRIRLGGSL